MTLNKWDPLRDLLDFQERANQMLGMGFDDSKRKRRVRWYPVVDVIETPDSFLFRAELPGVGRENINVEVHGATLILSGNRMMESEPKIAVYHTIERVQGFFERRFSLPNLLDVDRITANYVDGILEVTVPKRSEESDRSICVQCAD
jgi:HSP20 family protein